MTDIWATARRVLTPKQLRILELRERHGLSLSQISYATGLSISSVRGHLRAAHHNLHKALTKEPA